MTEDPSPGRPPDSAPDRLDSWKDIASYLKRDVSTAQRWEKREGMPVHRHQHDKLGSVYAFPAELDAWWRSRQLRLAANGGAQIDEGETAAALSPAEDRHARSASTPRRAWVIGAIAVTALAVAIFVILDRAEYFWQNPLANARFARLTEFEGTERAAAISRDGRYVAFLSDRDGPMDVWLTQIGTGRFHNLTKGKVSEIGNRDVRAIGFSPDDSIVTLWRRESGTARPGNIAVLAVPTLGGEPDVFIQGAAELDWSNDGRRLVYHTPAPGDPTFVRDLASRADRRIFTASPGLHSHFPVWSPDDEFIYFVYGSVPDDMDIWRVASMGGVAERITSHNSRVSHPAFLTPRTLLYLATDPDGSGPWLHAVDVERRNSRRIGLGIERYTSLATTRDGRRIVLTVASSKRSLWRMPVTDGIADERVVSRMELPTVHGRAPRFGSGYVLYVSSENDTDSIVRLAADTGKPVWSVKGGRVLGGAAVAPDGRRIAFAVEDRGQKRLYLLNAEGSPPQILPAELAPQGTPVWSPDGRSIAVAATIRGAPCLAMVSVEKQTFAPLVSGFAADPAWSPDGKFLVYSGPDVGTTFPLRAVGADGRPHPARAIILSRGARRVGFLGDNALVIAKGEMDHRNLWAIDLETGAERQLTNFDRGFVIDDFDISPDDREIIFERTQDTSDIVLIER